MAKVHSPPIAYCGICYNDYGRYVPLTGPFKPSGVFGCPFCQEERHPRGIKTRESTHPFKEVAAPMTFNIPHVISGPQL